MVVPTENLIKCLTGSADDLSSLLACTHYLSAGYRVWAPPQRSLVRKLLKTSSSSLWLGRIVLRHLIHLAHKDPECEGRWPKTPERLGLWTGVDLSDES